MRSQHRLIPPSGCRLRLRVTGLVPAAQLVGSWGNIGDKNFKNDPDGQMRRLMDPQFSAFAFFRALGRKDRLADMDPVEVRVAHLVQVCPRTRKRLKESI